MSKPDIIAQMKKLQLNITPASTEAYRQTLQRSLAAIEERIASGVAFTYATLAQLNEAMGGNEGVDRTADRTIQKWRRAGKIAFTREGRDVVWRQVQA